MNNKLQFLTFWAINGPMDIKKLKGQLKDMKESGFQGTLFHPRYYPNRPEYLSVSYMDILSRLILYAKELEMEFWIYDENGWPSGRADGKVMEALGDCVCEWLVYENGKVQKKELHQVNTLSKKAMECFVRITYDGYRKGLLPEAFDYVTGFFSDEVGFLDGHGVSIQTGGVPWHDEIPDRYEKKYQEDFPDTPEGLFVESPGYEKLRYRFWEILADILAENYYGRINGWCEKYGKKYAAHLKGEENLFFQVSPSGSAFRNLLHVNTPAVDALERYPGNHYYPRIASSIGRQFGDGSCMAEVLGGSGWGLSPEDMEKYVDWLAESGITTYVFHVSQYQKNTASVHDWPPDIPFGLNWRQIFPSIFDRLHRRWDICVDKESLVLLIAPARRVMSEFDPVDSMCVNEHNGAGVPDTKSGRCSNRFSLFAEQMYRRGLKFDVTEEWAAEQYGKLEDGKFYLNRQAYQTVIYSEDCLWENKENIDSLRHLGLAHPSDEFMWSFKKAGINQILLQEHHIRLEYHCDHSEGEKKWVIVSMDKLSRLTVMDEELPAMKKAYWYWFTIPDISLRRAEEKGYLEICYEGTLEEPEPLVFLQGDFLVKNKEQFLAHGKRQVKCKGSFYLVSFAPESIDCKKLVETGFPFMRDPVTVESRFLIGSDGKCRVGAQGTIYAEAAKIMVDGCEKGYVWGPDWTVYDLEPGLHTITLELIPSTYNTYGPHHYYQGDFHIISPAQYAGEKNFADAPDAPPDTRSEEWHFVKFGIE